MVIIDVFVSRPAPSTVPYDKICVTSRVISNFTPPGIPGSSDRKITNPEATQTLYSMYPFEVRR
jgi:hypothetical protein